MRSYLVLSRVVDEASRDSGTARRVEKFTGALDALLNTCLIRMPACAEIGLVGGADTVAEWLSDNDSNDRRAYYIPSLLAMLPFDWFFVSLCQPERDLLPTRAIYSIGVS
jgi:hypothetical protein